MMRIFLYIITALLLWAESALAGVCPATIAQGTTTLCDSITQYGITWTLSANETVGQFINGDYFVVNDGNSVISSVSPAPTGSGSEYRNGSMVNPSANSKQGHDGRAGNYVADTSVSFPHTLSAGESIVSTKSQTTDTNHLSIIGDSVQLVHGVLSDAAVLTCLVSQPPANSFRPGLAGTIKKLYNLSDVKTSLLPAVTPPTSPPQFPGLGATWGLAYAAIYQRPWLHYGADWQGRALHPTNNMPNYYRESFGVDAEAMALLICNITDRDKLLVNFLQRAIDMYSVAQSSTTGGDRMMSKAVVTFAGTLFGDADMWDSGYTGYREMNQPYYGTGWHGQTVLWRDKRGLEYEQAALADWKTVVVTAGCGCKAEAYRRDSHSWNWVGSALAIRGIGSVANFGNTAYFDYLDRWMTETDVEATILAECSLSQTSGGINTNCSSYTNYPDSGDTRSPFVTELWASYRSSFEGASCDSAHLGLCTTSPTCVSAGGNFCSGFCQVESCPVLPDSSSLLNFLSNGKLTKK